jgi:hypothetical protein
MREKENFFNRSAPNRQSSLSILFEKAPLTDFLGGTERSLIDPTVIDECVEDKIVVNVETARHRLNIGNRRRRNAVLSATW